MHTCMYRCVNVYTNAWFTYFHLFMYTYKCVKATQRQSRSSCRAARDSIPVYIIYICIYYLYTHVFMYICLYIYICIHWYTSIYIFIYTCIYIYMYIYICLYTLTYIYIYIFIHWYTCVNMYTCVCTLVHI